MEKKKHIFDDPGNVRRLILIFFVVCAVTLALDFFVHRHLSFEEGVFGIEGWFGFYGIYGFVACVLLVLIAKEVRKVLMRPEDYYDQDAYDQDSYDPPSVPETPPEEKR